MKSIKEKKPRKIGIQILTVLIVSVVFILLLGRYYGQSESPEKGNPRFVKIDYAQLEKEASYIKPVIIPENQYAESVFVLTYHVISKSTPEDDYEISYEQFKTNMFVLKSQGYNTVTLEDFYSYMRGEKNLPDKSFILTFDDGTKSAFYNADPILKVLNYTAVMFIITEHSLNEKQSAYYLNETELLAVQQTGRWDLQSHTDQSHYRLPITQSGNIAPALTNKLWIPEEKRVETDQEYFSRVSSDLTNAKNLLENKLNQEIIALALPYGDFGERGSNYPAAQGILYSLTTDMHKLVFYQFPIKNRVFKGNYPGEKQDSYVIVRLPADSFRNSEKLLQRIESSRALELPYHESYTNYDRWPRISGEASFGNESLILKLEKPSDDILFAYLDGSYLWEDYTYSITLDNQGSSTISLLSRLTTTLDYVSCQYNQDSVSLVQANYNSKKRIKSKAMENLGLERGTILSMSVEGNQVSCFIDEKMIVSENIPDISPNGGVGIKAEGFATENRQFEFKDISILG